MHFGPSSLCRPATRVTNIPDDVRNSKEDPVIDAHVHHCHSGEEKKLAEVPTLATIRLPQLQVDPDLV